MIFNIHDWMFDADIAATMELSAAQADDHCMCGYCRNYYSAIDQACPNFRRVLSSFGLDLEGPDEMCPYEPTIYEVTYIVQGEILQQGTLPLYIDGVPLTIKTAAELDFHTSHPKPYFALNVGLIETPWVLDEPKEDVISPANEPACLERMEKKLLAKMDAEEFFS